MRVISGKWKGRKITPPIISSTRPTTDRTKESLFSWLEARYDLQDANVLELFAGFGGIGLEFLSHGAAFVTWVEKNKKCTAFLQNLVHQFDIQQNTQIISSDCLNFLKKNTTVFDVIFIDPPYEYEFKEQILEFILLNPILRPGGLLIFEHRANFQFPSRPECIESRTYGEACLSFYEKNE